MTDPVDIPCPKIAIVNIEIRSAGIGISGGRWSSRARGREKEGMKRCSGTVLTGAVGGKEYIVVAPRI